MLGNAFFMPRCGVQGKPPGLLCSTAQKARDGARRDLNRRISDFLHGFAILNWVRLFPQPISSGQKSRST
jgi:hypothetical protein